MATIYPGYLRHHGTFQAFLLAMVWLSREDEEALPAGPVARMTGQAASLVRTWLVPPLLLVLLSLQLEYSADSARIDVERQLSANAAFGRFLQAPEWSGAIIVGEPDYLVESLPAYAKNPIYLARSGRFRDWVKFTSERRYRLTLGELLTEVRALKQRSGKRVLLCLGNAELPDWPGGESNHGWRHFEWSAADRDRLVRETAHLADFLDSTTDERYRVWEVR